jgi:hypothetical protein
MLDHRVRARPHVGEEAMPGRYAVFALSLAMVTAPSVLLTPPAVAAPNAVELCFGQLPTIVGTPGEQVIGTDGPDIVVSNSARYVDTLGGDDLVCVTGKYASADFDEYHDGPVFATRGGHDRIDTSKIEADSDYLYLYVSPGRGPDEVIGGPTVREQVFSGVEDTVDLGPGEDTLFLRLRASGGLFTGGVGDTLVFRLPHTAKHSWRADNGSGLITRDGEQMASFTGFSRFSAHAQGNFVFVGSDDRELFEMRVNRAWAPLETAVKVRMGGGNDRVNFSGAAQGARFDGGDGVDMFDYSAGFYAQNKSVVFNMTSGLLKDSWPNGQTTTRRAISFENAVVSNGQLPNPGPTTLKGTSGPNWLKVWGPGSSTIYGKAGDDEMIGWGGSGALFGGRGHDIAQGGDGVTQCQAEVTLDC